MRAALEALEAGIWKKEHFSAWYDWWCNHENLL